MSWRRDEMRIYTGADLGKKIEGGFMCRPLTVKLTQYKLLGLFFGGGGIRNSDVTNLNF